MRYCKNRLNIKPSSDICSSIRKISEKILKSQEYLFFFRIFWNWESIYILGFLGFQLIWGCRRLSNIFLATAALVF